MLWVSLLVVVETDFVAVEGWLLCLVSFRDTTKLPHGRTVDGQALAGKSKHGVFSHRVAAERDIVHTAATTFTQSKIEGDDKPDERCCNLL